jgi:hypothetical protein
MNQDLNPLEVPTDKEDKKTADEDLSFNDSNHQAREIDSPMRDVEFENQTNQAREVKGMVELEEEKEVYGKP